MTNEPPLVGTPRQVLQQRRNTRIAWLLLLGGLIVPPLALVAAVMGNALRGTGRDAQVVLLVGLGVTIFVVRLFIYAI